MLMQFLRAKTHWNMIEKRLRQLLFVRLYVRLAKIRTNETNAAINIEADAAWRNDRIAIRDVKCGHISDRKSVA